MITIRKSYLIILLFSFLAINTYSQTKKTFTIVIDAGHGGHDPGTMGNRKYKKHEKDVALSIALKFGKLIEKNLKDVKVVYTRKTDVFIKLKDRPKIANDNNADLFVSIHCNASKNSAAKGSETYVLGVHKNETNLNVAKKENSVIYLEKDYSVNYDGFDPQSTNSLVALTIGQEEYIENSLLLASLIQENIKKTTALKSRGLNGVNQAGFWVLARNSMPSVLVETGFLSNPQDAKYLMSNRGQDKVANALYLGFKEYKKYWDEQVGLDIDELVVDNTTKVEKADNGIVYGVQLLSGKVKLKPTDKAFKGLENITYYKSNSFYKYVYNKVPDYDTALKMKDKARSKGFKTAFIVAFKNGKRIPLIDALKEDEIRK